MSRILGIETSCDETGVAMVEDGRRIIASEVASQVEIHALFGGVVPEIASRRHTDIISELTRAVVDASGGRPPDAVAATCGPGLMGSLLVGVNFAKALSFGWGRPYLPVHHLEGHLFSVFLDQEPPAWPFLALIVSGGHTCLVECEAPGAYRILGRTRDDAVGESFDKVARLLDLPYPGGPSIQREAGRGDPQAYDFPRSMAASGDLDFSYSGLKTAVLYKLRQGGCSVPDLAASFQEAAVDVLVIKTQAALKQTGAERLVLAGGVAANKLLRTRLTEETDAEVFLPPLSLCVDNGAMIACAGHVRFEAGRYGSLGSTADPGLPLDAPAGAGP